MLLSLVYFKDDKSPEIYPKQLASPGVIAEALSRLQLAISQMAGFILETGCSLKDLLALYSARDNSRQLHHNSKALDKFHYQYTLETAWSLSIPRLKPKARNVLDIVSMLDTDSIPEILLKDVCTSSHGSGFPRDFARICFSVKGQDVGFLSITSLTLPLDYTQLLEV